MKKNFIILIALVLIFTNFAYGQNFFNILGSGARARGMGGAFIGIADDATAVSWNPAGLTKLEKPEASVVGIYESYIYSNDLKGVETDPYNYSHFGLNFLSAALPLSIGTKNVVGALAFQQMVSFYEKYETDNWLEETTGGLYAITPAIGFQLTPNISIGAAFNIYTGKQNYIQEDKTGFLNKSENENKYSGSSLNIGGLFDFNKFRVGVVYKSAYDITGKNSETDLETISSMPNIFGVGLAYLPTEKLSISADYESRAFSEFRAKSDLGEQKPEWENVNQLRLGAEYLLMSGESILPLRLGVASTPTPLKDSNGDQISGINLSAGIGIIMGNINLDLGIEYNTYLVEGTNEYGDTYNASDNYLRFLVSGVFHLGK